MYWFIMAPWDLRPARITPVGRCQTHEMHEFFDLEFQWFSHLNSGVSIAKSGGFNSFEEIFVKVNHIFK